MQPSKINKLISNLVKHKSKICHSLTSVSIIKTITSWGWAVTSSGKLNKAANLPENCGFLPFTLNFGSRSIYLKTWDYGPKKGPGGFEFFQIISLFLHSPFCRATDPPENSGQNQNLGHLAKMAWIRPNFRLWSEKKIIYDFEWFEFDQPNHNLNIARFKPKLGVLASGSAHFWTSA